MEIIIFLAYITFAIYSGNKVITGRFEWLERSAPLNVACKYFLSAMVGGVIAGFYLVYLILQLIVLFFWRR